MSPTSTAVVIPLAPLTNPAATPSSQHQPTHTTSAQSAPATAVTPAASPPSTTPATAGSCVGLTAQSQPSRPTAQSGGPPSARFARLKKGVSASAWLGVGLALGALVIGVYYGEPMLRLARWTAQKDFREACKDDFAASTFSPQCNATLAKPLGPPPIKRQSPEAVVLDTDWQPLRIAASITVGVYSLSLALLNYRQWLAMGMGVDLTPCPSICREEVSSECDSAYSHLARYPGAFGFIWKPSSQFKRQEMQPIVTMSVGTVTLILAYTWFRPYLIGKQKPIISLVRTEVGLCTSSGTPLRNKCTHCSIELCPAMRHGRGGFGGCMSSIRIPPDALCVVCDEVPNDDQQCDKRPDIPICEGNFVHGRCLPDYLKGRGSLYCSTCKRMVEDGDNNDDNDDNDDDLTLLVSETDLTLHNYVFAQGTKRWLSEDIDEARDSSSEWRLPPLDMAEHRRLELERKLVPGSPGPSVDTRWARRNAIAGLETLMSEEECEAKDVAKRVRAQLSLSDLSGGHDKTPGTGLFLRVRRRIDLALWKDDDQPSVNRSRAVLKAPESASTAREL